MIIAAHSKAKQAVHKLMRHKLVRNVGWLAGAELVSRVGRVFAAVVLARQLDAAAFGVAAIALTIFEITRVFTENGIGAAVIRATSSGFDRVANTAHRLMWIVCLVLSAVQVGAGLAVEAMLPGRGAGLMVASLGFVFLMMPLGVMHAYCLQRDERMKALAAITTAQVAADHVLTAVLAIAGFGAWAIVLPKILTTPIWLVGMLRSRAWTRNRTAGYSGTTSILKFSLPVLGSELMRACRDQLDKVIISMTLGVEALGLYYFAFNAGLGVSTALNRAFSNAVYPHICAARDQIGAFRKSILQLGLPFGALYCLQAMFALIYVPIVFGPTWASAAPLVALLCLGGPARLFVDTVRMKARAQGHSGQDFQISVGFSAVVLFPFALFASCGLFIVSALSVAAASIFALVATCVALGERSLQASTNLGAKA